MTNKYQEALDSYVIIENKGTTIVTINNQCKETLQELINKYKDMKNELCLQCGKYKNEHLGACAECRWHDGK